jgi:predicted nucleic acid-binding Zn ribbon protein
MDDLPNPDVAERNQERKLQFIPMWPIVGAIVIVVVLVLLLR